MIPTTMERYENAITGAGLMIEGREQVMGREMIKAFIEVGSHKLSIICGDNGTARIDKPNGTHKWVYEKSYAQIGALLRQTLSFYKFR